MRRSHLSPPATEALAAGAHYIAALKPHAIPLNQPKGTVLFRQGQPSSGGYLLLAGQARLYLERDDGRTVAVRTVGPGYLLGLPGTILNRRYLFTAKLTRDSSIAFVPTNELLKFLRERSDLCLEIVEMLGGELLDLPPAVQPRATRTHRRHHRGAA